MEIKYAGRHVIIDGVLSEESKSVCTSTEKMDEYLREVSRITGMTLVVPPISMKFPFSSEVHKLINNIEDETIANSAVLKEYVNHINKRDTQDSGVSAISIWLESHCTLHSWPEQNYISIDLFSCKEFDVEPVVEFTREFMKLDSDNTIVVDRNMNAPAKITTYKESEVLCK